MRYTVILEQESDGGYVATVPALPGCVSQGDTRDEVMKYIREAADLSRRENKQRRVAWEPPHSSEAGRRWNGPDHPWLVRKGYSAYRIGSPG
jgi:hypothetical protein